jgi:hypothetical protein
MTRLLASASAVLLGSSGFALLFAADEALQRLGGSGPAAAVAGQLLGGAWLALAVATWITRGAPQGGIYGRPIVLANMWVYTITALVCLRAFSVGAAVSTAAVVSAALAVSSAYLLFRGPFDPPRGVDG